MANVTYLLGAGASFHSLPLVLEIPTHLQIFADYVFKLPLGGKQKSYGNDIIELKNEVDDYNTIDSYARMLFLSEKAESKIKLAKLKSILCGLFMFEQLKKRYPIATLPQSIDSGMPVKPNANDFQKLGKTLDARYKSWFGKIIKGRCLNDEVNIISWNYDLQIEIGLESVIGCSYNSVTSCGSIFPHPLFDVKNVKTTKLALYHELPKVVKLNGTAGVFRTSERFDNIYISQEEFFDDHIDVLLDVHKEALGRYVNYNPYLLFAWENENTNEVAIEYARKLIERTNVLVVIGYSFPDYNRPIDSIIFQNSRVRRVYLQVPQKDYNTILSKRSASINITGREVSCVDNLVEFFIPPEFKVEY